MTLPQPPGLRRSCRYRGYLVEAVEGGATISLKLGNPRFTAPIFANLFDDPDGESYTLNWSWGRKSTVD